MSKFEGSVVIVGSGIGGLTAALSLVRRGIEVTVIERFDQVREVGAGILLTPNASGVLYRLGLGAAIEARSAPMTRGAMMTSRGKLLVEQAATAPGDAPFRMIHRAALQQVLYEAVGPERVHLGAACTGFEPTTNGAAALLDDGRHIEGTVLVGADGLHSAIRARMFGASPPRYCGYTCWRGITAPFSHPDFPPGTLAELQGRGARFGTGYVDAERIYWWATLDTPEGERDDRAPLHPRLLEVFGDWPPFVPAMIHATDADTILRNDIYDRPPIFPWGTGPVTLLGDAAHPMAPNLGQGACSAIEDGAILAHSLATSSDPVQALREYERRRRARTAMLQRASYWFGVVGQWRGGAAVTLRELVMRSTPAAVANRQQDRIWKDYEAMNAVASPPVPSDSRPTH